MRSLIVCSEPRCNLSSSEGLAIQIVVGTYIYQGVANWEISMYMGEAGKAS